MLIFSLKMTGDTQGILFIEDKAMINLILYLVTSSLHFKLSFILHAGK